ncbi:glycoside hydrolase family 16 protein [Nocardioides aequoreus]|uniref:glycoside hydrolase family 16 protein n=1 Tax=Nocardioides aequoreus TaxID=397278 RepID=UPI00055BE736|nr:glycoside hydrolase family 16 protein [Nocardioides aequoreus]
MSRITRLVAGAAGLALVLTTGTIALDDTPAQAAGVSAKLSVARPLPNESVAVRGAVAPAKRKVVLQQKAKGRWKSVKSTRTKRGGAYAFSVKATTSSRTFRVVAPATKIGKKRYSTRTSRGVKVLARAASAPKLDIAPAPVGQLRDRTAYRTPGVATFSPARPGTAVQVQRYVGTSWVTQAKGAQDSKGWFRFNLPRLADGTSAQYRAVTFPGKGAATVVGGAVSVTAQKQVFAEDFNGSALSSKWVTRAPGLYHGRRMCATPKADRVSVSGGIATLSVKRIAKNGTRSPADSKYKCVGGVWDNAMVGTGGAASPYTFKYGTAAARVRFQKGQGMHSGFWLQGPAVTGAEIDIAEYYGDGHRSGLQTKVHRTLSNGKLSTSGGKMNVSSVVAKGRTPASGWHVYSVDWTPTRYVFRVDGVVTWVSTKDVSQAPEEVVLSLLTSDWALDDFKTSESSKMYVDWVRVWQ